MSPIVEVEVRRNRHGSVLAYADRDRAARLLADHRAVLQALYELVDRRHGADGETVARLTVREDERAVDEFALRDGFRRDLDPDRVLALVEDLRYYAGERTAVADGGGGRVARKHRESHFDSDGAKGEISVDVPLTWCTEYTIEMYGVHTENFAGKIRRRPADNGAESARGEGEEGSR